MVTGAKVTLFTGNETLEVVGESHYQDALWACVGGRSNERVHHPIHAVLVAETDNPYDASAIAVWIDGFKVGHLSRQDATAYRPGLLRLERDHDTHVTLAGAVIGGGQRDDGLGLLGVFLDHDPSDFGIVRTTHRRHVPLEQHVRTGASEVRSTPMSWATALPSDSARAITYLRQQLSQVHVPIERHYLYAELEHQLYRCRDSFTSALDDFDEVCEAHHKEMAEIRPALVAEFGGIPMLETYRQACIRHQKAGAWSEVRTWASHGLGVYGADVLDPSNAADLKQRSARAEQKLQPKPARAPARPRTTSAPSDPPAIETLACAHCGTTFERQVLRGRKPSLCPSCRSVPVGTG